MSKDCGECGLCCKLMGVRGVPKPPHSWCRHYAVGQGCRIYDDRPAECRDFVCYWLRIEALGPQWRPDRARFVMHLTHDGDTLEVEVDPSHPHAWRRQPYYDQLRAWAVSGARRGLSLRVWVGERCFAIRPEGDVDLGRLRSLALIQAELPT